MEHKSVTQTEIQQAEELQRFGLCQGAKGRIWFEFGEYIFDISGIGHAEQCRIGPLPTASECFPEMAKIVMPHKTTSEGTAYIFELISKHMHCGDLDQAFRQALIGLEKEEKCQNG